MSDGAISELRENYDKMTPKLRARVDSMCAALPQVGRKPFPATKLRSRKIQICFNEGEFARVAAALGDDVELARGIRELVLKAADEIIASREN